MMPKRITETTWRQLALTLFVLLNLGLVAILGVRSGGDTGMYREGAYHLLRGEPLAERQPSYSGYVAFLAGAELLRLGNTGIALLQIAIATFAASLLFSMAKNIGGLRTALLSTVLLTLDIETNRWNAYILSDSIFTSLFTMSVWLVHRATQGDVQPPKQLLALGISLACALTRPEGWFFLPAAGLWLLLVDTLKNRVVVVGVAVIAIVALTLAIPNMEGNVSAISPNEMLRLGQTIWSYDGWRVPMPQDTIRASGEAAGAITYALRHPLSTAMLFSARVAVHFGHIRPYYSSGHNAMVLAWLIPIYAMAVVGWWTVRHLQLARWSLVALATQTAVVAIGHADWDGRYLAHVLPLMYPFAAFGVFVALRPSEARAPGTASVTRTDWLRRR